MNIQHLLVFREIMETGSVSAAARNLHRTQPAVSSALKTLENSLGTSLFNREGKRLVPIPEAHYLFAEAINILEKLQATEAQFQDILKGQKGELRVASMPGTSVHLMPQFLSDFTATRENLKIVLSTRSSPQILNLVASQNYDVGFCDAEAKTKQAHLLQIHNVLGFCVAAIPLTHELASKDSLEISDLSDVPMGTLLSNHYIVDKIRNLFQFQQANFNVSVQTQYFTPLLKFVEMGRMCSIVDPLTAVSYKEMSQHNLKIRFVPLKENLEYRYSILIPAQRPLSSVATDFKDQWINYVERLILTTP